MSLETQLSVWGLSAALGLALFVWMSSVWVGRFLLPASEIEGSALDRLALTAPWGFLFLVSIPAAVVSSGTSALTIVPPLQLGLWALIRFRAQQARVLDTEIGERPGPAPSPATIVLFVAAVIVGMQLVSLLCIMPYHGAGRWQIPFEDHSYWGMLAHQLALRGVETLGTATIPTVSPDGNVLLTWYHWAEFWMAGLVARWSGLNALLVLYFSVQPLLMAMSVLCIAAILSHFVRWNGLVWILAVGAMFAGGLGDLFRQRPLFTDSVIPIANYVNQTVPILLVLCGTLHLLRSRDWCAAMAIGLAILLSAPLAPAVLAALLLLAAISRSRFVFPALVVTAIAGLWLVLSGHGVGAHGPATQIAGGVTAGRVPTIVSHGIASLLLALGTGLPYVFGLYVLRRRGAAVHLAAATFLVTFFAMAALGDRDSDVPQLEYAMWAAFVIPLGWSGLSKTLVEGRHPWVTAIVMAVLVAGGIRGIVVNSGSELARSAGTYTASEVDHLRQTCQGRRLGFFSPDTVEARFWWLPVESGWAALSGCPIVRLNRVPGDDTNVLQRFYWESSAPAAYAHAQGVEWTNTPPVMLGFAKDAGIIAIAENARHPIPPDVRPYLEPWQQAGPFMLYRVR